MTENGNFTLCHMITWVAFLRMFWNLSAAYRCFRGPSWPWSYGSWIYNYLCNQYLSPLMLWVWISIRARCTTLCDKVCQWLATCLWFSPGTQVSSTNKTDHHDIAEILLKVELNTTMYKPNLYLKKGNCSWSQGPHFQVPFATLYIHCTCTGLAVS